VLWERLYRLKQRGVTLVLTTHYMDEAEQLCDRLVVMDHGRIAAEGSPAELIRRYSTREVCELRFPLVEGQPGPEQFVDVLQPVVDRGAAERIEVLPDRLLIYAADGEAALAAVAALDVRPQSSLVRRSSLEDVFLRLTGRTLVD
jgi:lipooligosaccharide transport system ATP-binding protein